MIDYNEIADKICGKNKYIVLTDTFKANPDSGGILPYYKKKVEIIAAEGFYTLHKAVSFKKDWYTLPVTDEVLLELAKKGRSVALDNGIRKLVYEIKTYDEIKNLTI